jgi:hypothetical protein
MGIFDRGGGKKGQDKPAAGAPAAEEGDYYDSPVETVSLNDAPKAGGGAPKAAPAKASAATQDDEPRPHYGIENAIQLMRALPVDQNVELVVAVIKGTLESLKVKVSDIIEDASRKQKDLEGRVTNLKQQIADFEKEISTRKDEITRLEADHAETTSVKGRLELAEKHQKAAPPPAAPGAQKPLSGTIASGGKA